MATLKRSFWAHALALSWLAILLLVAVLAPYLPLPYAAATPDLLQVAIPPFTAGSQHWLGTDTLGRDVLANLVFGARTTVLLTFPTALLATLLGAVLGGVAGFWGNTLRLPAPYWLFALGWGWWGLGLPAPTAGLVLMAVGAVWAAAGLWWPLARAAWRWPLPIDSLVLGAIALLGSVPRLLLVLVLAAGAGVSFSSLLVLLTLTSWPGSARLVRAEMQRLRILPFMEAGRAAGLPLARLWLFHAFPQALRPLRSALPLSIASLVGLESSLSFLGVGLAPDVASWGHLLSTARLELRAWWLFCLPVTCLVLTLLSLIRLAKAHQSSKNTPKTKFLL